MIRWSMLGIRYCAAPAANVTKKPEDLASQNQKSRKDQQIIQSLVVAAFKEPLFEYLPDLFQIDNLYSSFPSDSHPQE